MMPSEKFSEKLLSLRSDLGLSQSDMGEKLGLSLNYISSLERGKKDPSDAVVKHVSLLEEAIQLGYGRAQESALRDDPAQYVSDRVSRSTRMIPVVSWAHAGEAESYEELPKEWQEMVPTECPDPDAFSVILNGDSMEPRFYGGDQLIVMPNKRPLNGGLVVCRFKDDGIIFRQVEVIGEKIKLVPINVRYTPTDHTEEDFAWIYPLWGMYRQLWK